MPARRGTARRTSAAATAAAALLSMVGGCSSTPDAAPVVHSYLAAWSRGDASAAAADTDNPAAAMKALQQLTRDLDATAVHATAGPITTSNGKSGRAQFTADIQLAGLGTWHYTGTLALTRADKDWRVHWVPSDIHPSLTATTTLGRERTLGARAALLDDHGQPLFAPTPVVIVGLEPARVTAATYRALADALSLQDIAGVEAAVKAASPHDFVPVITLRRTDYEKVRSRIHDLPGTVFHTDTMQLAPTSSFARAVIGRVGPATADVLKAAGSDYRAGDILGIGGLEQAFQSRLAGRPSGAVVLRDAHGATSTVLHRFPGMPGQPVRTTLDPAVQEAAEQALDTAGKPGAVVVVRPSDGAILAAANAPGDSTFDRALDGRYPPGSTLKVSTTYALLGHGFTPTSSVPCPTTVTVDGKQFRNFEGEAAGSVPLSKDFAISCNTAFIDAAGRLSGSDLSNAANAFGIGAHWALPIDAFSGSVPTPTTPVDKAATAIGQARVQVSPLAMALMAAAVDNGTWHAPVLVTDPAQQAGGTPPALNPGRIATLRQLMLGVVTHGTAASAGLPSGTAGKTGTAEFGTGPTPATHAWFIGYHGDLAISVIVEGGGVGGTVAAPIAAAVLRAALSAVH